MKLKKSIFIFFATLVLLGSCTKEKKKKCKEKGTTKLVLNAIFPTNDSIFLHVSKSASICESTPSFVKDANIKLYKNGDLVNQFTHVNNGFYKPHIPIILSHSSNYYLVASTPDLGEVNASQNFPKPTDFEFNPSNFIQNDMDISFNCEISFIDDLNNKNYYAITLSKIDSTPNVKDPSKFHKIKTPIAGFTKDPLVIKPYSDLKKGYYGYFFLLSDDSSNGQRHSTNIFVKTTSKNQDIKRMDIEVELKTLSTDYFKYYLSQEKNKIAQENPLYPRIKIHSNINNGFGIFGGYSVIRKKFAIKRIKQQN